MVTWSAERSKYCRSIPSALIKSLPDNKFNGTWQTVSICLVSALIYPNIAQAIWFGNQTDLTGVLVALVGQKQPNNCANPAPGRCHVEVADDRSVTFVRAPKMEQTDDKENPSRHNHICFVSHIFYPPKLYAQAGYFNDFTYT
jgi:hypothetical protein